MKPLKQTLLAASLTLFALVPAFASQGHEHARSSGQVMQRLDNQQQRIAHGIRSRQLTHKEARVLQQEQWEIRHLVRRYHEDGRFSNKELRILDRRLDKSSLQIKRLRHNDLERYVQLHERYGHTDHERRL